jgi:hypothetical protein
MQLAPSRRGGLSAAARRGGARPAAAPAAARATLRRAPASSPAAMRLPPPSLGSAFGQASLGTSSFALPRAAAGGGVAGGGVTGGGGASNGAPAAPPDKAQWRVVDDATVVGLIPAVGSPKVKKFELRPNNVPPAIAALAAAGRRVPVVLGPPVGGEAQAGELTASLESRGHLLLSSAALLRLVRASAAALGAPPLFVLRAEAGKGRIRAWLAADDSAGAALEAGQLPAGASQLSEEALAVEAAAGLPWAPAGQDTAIGKLDAICKKEARDNNSLDRRVRIPALAVPPAAKALFELAAGAGKPVPVPLLLGPPSGAAREVDWIMEITQQKDENLHINSAPLVRLLRSAHFAAGVAQLSVVLRAEPGAGRLRMWLAPAGSTGPALEAPNLPAGVAQLSARAVAAAPRVPRAPRGAQA